MHTAAPGPAHVIGVDGGIRRNEQRDDGVVGVHRHLDGSVAGAGLEGVGVERAEVEDDRAAAGANGERGGFGPAAQLLQHCVVGDQGLGVGCGLHHVFLS